jgi:shikimate kinase/3-dehydroquinate synthase
MGAGKSTIATEVAQRLARPLVDTDETIEQRIGTTVADFFAQHGEPEFRRVEEEIALDALRRPEPAVVALGGGTVQSAAVRDELRRRALTVWLEIDVADAWARAAGPERPLARDEDDFRRLYEEREPLYGEVADARAGDADGVVLAAGGIVVETAGLGRLAELVPGEAPVALVADGHVAGIHGADAQVALGPRLESVHAVPAGEPAKTPQVLETLWRELRLDRQGTLVALGGGSTTDVAGFVAATYLRGIAWAPVPTTLVGQVDAAIGGKTAVDLPEGKNLVGAFHWPARTLIDPALLATLPARERRNGMAEVVKTGLLAGDQLWELPDEELVRRCAAFKTAVCLRDPLDRGERAILNLGHTFAHALETAADFALPHGQAVALGLRAALTLSGIDSGPVDDVLAPKPVRVDAERAWEAMRRDKKSAQGKIRLVLLERPGEARWPVELPEADVRAALAEIIAS